MESELEEKTTENEQLQAQLGEKTTENEQLQKQLDSSKAAAELCLRWNYAMGDVEVVVQLASNLESVNEGGGGGGGGGFAVKKRQQMASSEEAGMYVSVAYRLQSHLFDRRMHINMHAVHV